MTAGPDPLLTILQYLGYETPYVLVYLIGIAVAVTRLRRHRTAATLALVALVLMLVVGIGATVAQGYLISEMMNAGVGSTAGTLLTVVGWAWRLLNVAGIALLITAVFAGRRQPPRDED